MADEDNKLNYGLGMAVGAILSVIGAAFGQTVGVYTSGDNSMVPTTTEELER
jgi:hypothetical protein